VSALKGLLAADVVVHSDGGGKRPAAGKPVIGVDVVARFFRHWAEVSGFRRPAVLHLGLVDGLPGYVTREPDGIQVTAFAVEGDRIAAIYVVRNPDKLERLARRFGRG
jgi:RNA polymerase sigma-70 factor (ECF subfamily)